MRSKKTIAVIGLALASIAMLAGASGPSLFRKDNVVAWCIVPFDVKQRGPEERAAMLKRLGITKLAYDWREKDIPTFDRELDALKQNGIALHAFWLTSGPDPSQDKSVAAVFDFLRRRHVKTEIWYLFIPPKGFDGLSQQEKIDTAGAGVSAIAAKAAEIGCSVGLYNHGGWFGEPENQIAIIQKLKKPNVGIVYNFHHGREQMDRFPELLAEMLPYLKAINLNGMSPDGPMIIPVGQGRRELEMMRIIANSSYHGPIGILGHREDQDAEKMLAGNLEGLERLSKDLKAPTHGD